MNKLIYCITSVNKDIFGGIKAAIAGASGIFTKKFWQDNAPYFIMLGVIVGILAGCIGALLLGIHVAITYFPHNSTVFQWLPIATIWLLFFVALYVGALFNKCRKME